MEKLQAAGVRDYSLRGDIIEASAPASALRQALRQACPEARLVPLSGAAKGQVADGVNAGQSGQHGRKPRALMAMLQPSTPRQEIMLLALTSLWLLVGLIIDPAWPASLFLLLPPYLWCGWPVLKRAGISLRHRQLFNEFTLMSSATLAAIVLGQVSEALAVMLFYQIGEFFQERAAERSRGSIEALLASKPAYAELIGPDGQARQTLVEEIAPGSLVMVPAGGIVPLDGAVKSGKSMLDTSPLTGEAAPRQAMAGDEVLAGCICLDGHLVIEVSKPFAHTQLAQVLKLTQEAKARKSKVERFISRFAAIYTPCVFALAAGLALLPPLLGYGAYSAWIYKALVLLVISCPCALVVSVPLCYFGGIGRAARQGILVKGGVVLDALRDIKAVAFDKTGTLTQGEFEVVDISPASGVSQAELLQGAMWAQSGSAHPLAQAVRRKALDLRLNVCAPAGIISRETAGLGVCTEVDDARYVAGSRAWLEAEGYVLPPAAATPGAIVHVGCNGRYLGSLRARDSLKKEAAAVIVRLKNMGLKTYLLSGDHAENVALAARELKLDGFRAGLMPADKVAALGELAGLEHAMFVGEGINDAPLLAASRVSVAMGKAGAAAAIESADAVLLNDDLNLVPKLLDTGRRTRVIAVQCIVLALGVKAIVLGLGVAGLASLWEAVFADAGVAVLAVLNATRMLRLQ